MFMKVTPYQKSSHMYSLKDIRARLNSVSYPYDDDITAVLDFGDRYRYLPIHYVFWSYGKQMEVVGVEPDLSNLICEYVVHKGKNVAIYSPQKVSVLRKMYGVGLSRTTKGY